MVGFNDRPAVIVDYTSDVDDVEARMVMLKPEEAHVVDRRGVPGSE